MVNLRSYVLGPGTLAIIQGVVGIDIVLYLDRTCGQQRATFFTRGGYPDE
jgi:hypothetical protein